jgi:hypothetical protein
MKIQKCPIHPKYKVIRKPKCQCTTCWDLWNIKHGLEELVPLTELVENSLKYVDNLTKKKDVV